MPPLMTGTLPAHRAARERCHYTIGQLARLRHFELLAIRLGQVLPGLQPAQCHTAETAAARASNDALMSLILDGQ